MNYWIEDIEHSDTVTIKLLHYHSNGDRPIDTSFFNHVELEKYNQYKSKKRQLEFYYTRVLWQAFNHPDNITYRSTGKPTLEKGFLSISHSHKAIAIAYSPTIELGIDIEPISKKIARVKHKFMRTEERFESLEDLTKAWCIKEAVYKLMDMDDVFFMDDIYLDTVEPNNSAHIKVEGIDVQPHFIVRKLKHDMMMAWAYINNSKISL
ncbi:MAG: 4'-phosphopantetheinyl transferase superfamily protein [Putridiphycobacter sp.]|nr:4'-phosphopantetheinyl transferase superfamily protein [Putridiphycobacter sp.]